MKKTQEIIGLPVIDLSSGDQIGKVWDIIFNGDRGTADYFIVDDGMIILGAKVIEAKDVQGIGDHALTVSKKDALRDAVEVENAINIFKKNVKVKNTKVLTQKGRLIGQTGDIFIDPKGCSISALEFSFFDNKEKIKIIPRKGIVTFGENLIVVVENLEEILRNVSNVNQQVDSDEMDSNNQVSYMDKRTDNLENATSFKQKDMLYVDEKNHKPQEKSDEMILQDNKEKTGEELKHTEPETNSFDELPEVSEEDFTVSNVNEEEIELPVQNNQEENRIETDVPDTEKEPEEEAVQNTDTQKPGNGTFKEGISAVAFTYKPGNQPKLESKQKPGNKHNNPKSSNLFEEKQKEFLIGRKVTKAIRDRQGNQILNQGEIITEDAINRAKDAGKLIEIVMNNRP